MHQVAFSIGGFAFYWYGVCLASAFVAGLLNATWLGRRTGRPFPLFSDLLFWVVVGGIAGARLAYVAANWDEFSGNMLRILNLRGGGLVFYGGIAGAFTAFLLFVRQHRENFWSLGDVAITSLPLGHALGRVGCFMQGCCHGTPTTSALGVVYPADSSVWHNQVHAGLLPNTATACLPVHPVQLYESAANLVIWMALILFYRQPHRDGRVAALYMMLYAVTRFSLEFMRGDERMRSLAHLSLAQMTSVALFAAGLGIWCLASRRTASGATQTEPR
jgi:phosphatidylglycerol:prolipoprotein diacylglycerol transferase